MLLQLELVTSPHRHDRHDPGPGIPTPELGDQGDLALIQARHLEADGPVQRARGGEQQSQAVTVPKPAVGQLRHQNAAALQAGPVHRTAEAQVQGPGAGTGQGRLNPHQAGRTPQQNLLLNQAQ